MDFLDSKTNRLTIDELLELHSKTTTARLHSQEKVKQLEKENEELRNYINSTMQEKAALENENSDLLEKLEDLKSRKHSQEVVNHFDLLCELLGYSLSDLEWDRDRQIKYLKCVYNADCYVRFGMSSAGKIELLEITPTHPNFESIRAKLQMTEDTCSLLANLRKYFSHEAKENMQMDTGN